VGENGWDVDLGRCVSTCGGVSEPDRPPDASAIVTQLLCLPPKSALMH
jgi:hypothetical protein